MLKLKLQYFDHLMQKANSLEETLMLGKIEGRRRRGDRGWDSWMASPTQWTWVWANFRSWWWTGKPGGQSMGSKGVGHDWATEINWISPQTPLSFKLPHNLEQSSIIPPRWPLAHGAPPPQPPSPAPGHSRVRRSRLPAPSVVTRPSQDPLK